MVSPKLMNLEMFSILYKMRPSFYLVYEQEADTVEGFLKVQLVDNEVC
jgi:hypothetical protein